MRHGVAFGRVGSGRVTGGITRIPKEVIELLELRGPDTIDYTWNGNYLILSRAV
jgi:hypothetical protein